MRVIYRGDLDGTVCAAMLLELDLCDELVQVHPQDMQHGRVEVTNEDIICNLPYHQNCHMWFDHHTSELSRVDFPTDYDGIARISPSAARLVFEYFEAEHSVLQKYEELIYEIDLFDGGILNLEQVKNPQGPLMLAFLLDPRTALGFVHDFSISNFQWSTQIPELLTMYSVEEILDMPDTAERVSKYRESEESSAAFYAENSHLDGNVIVCDLRDKEIPVANRFLIYMLPEFVKGNISVRIADGKKREFNTISVGHSIFNRTSRVDAAKLCGEYGGGGHMTAAACQVSLEESDRILIQVIEACKI
ncbi:MAG: exopolyphosphatase [Fidelibacterota bacterium]|nr:MAG: exopolyphosphatase [Candidatus Neomarinimicrobiota bacterium]